MSQEYHHQNHQQTHQNERVLHPVYETSGMLSEMFSFSHGHQPGPNPDILDYRRVVGSMGPDPDPDLGSRDYDQIGGINTAAMQLFLTNQHPRSPSSQPLEVFPHIWNTTHVDNNQAAESSGQGLSLSLSSSLKHLELSKVEEFRNIDGSNSETNHTMFFNKHQQGNVTGIGPSSSGHFFKNLAPGLGSDPDPDPDPIQIISGFGDPSSVQIHLGYGSASTSSLGVVNVLRNSKYAKPAQELLQEFCSVGRGQIKKPNLVRQDLSNQNPTSSGGGGGGESGGSTSSTKDPPQLTPADRIEHQRRKVKLLAMLDEVDKRYKHYSEQIHMVVNSMEVIMGYGASIPYTLVAQKAMSRHFRCLKEAIQVQLKHSCEMLGEKDPTTNSGITKGETPRLKVLEQSLRQQRAIHQMGMIDQESWRPQRGLPERSVAILRAWLFEHFLHPYPSDADKHLLARQTGLSRNQVSNWFINARVRLWKPMIEEMYQKESKDIEEETEKETTQNPLSSSSSEPKISSTECNTMLAPQSQLPSGSQDLGDTCHHFGGAQNMGPATIISFGNPSGDVSLTLGLRHAGNVPQKVTGFSVKESTQSKD
ncbi:unnamed protein product [Amaranthus hypochondriacus]